MDQNKGSSYPCQGTICQDAAPQSVDTDTTIPSDKKNWAHSIYLLRSMGKNGSEYLPNQLLIPKDI